MMPPVCALCGGDIEEGDASGGLVRFAGDEASRRWHERAEAAPGFTGHPPDVQWFCGAHIARARQLSDLPAGQALDRMRREMTAGPS